MEVSFDVDIDLDEDNDHSIDDCELHNDYDNQKLFDVFESYVNKPGISGAEREPELELNDHFYQLVTKRGAETPRNNRSLRRISCFADIENLKSVSKKITSNEELNQSLDDSMSETTLPFTLEDMSEQEIVDLINNLNEELMEKESNYPKMAANYMKEIFDKQINFFNDIINESEVKFTNSLQEINGKEVKERIVFSDLLDKELNEIKTKSEKMSKLLSDLDVIKDIINK